MAQLDKFIELTGANTPMEQAFQKAFGMSFENMEKELRAYIGRDRYPVFTGSFQSKLTFETEMQSAPITEAEAQAYLGDLLLHAHRADGEA